ncbi:MAG: hypothetical protein KAG96_07955 [Ichthyobacteriaceae bacterium]|nr:hypothetical protein [Ichthyobacteriaceae bacterium]
MKRFVKNILIFLSPLLLIVLAVVIADPFKVWFSYDDYYSDYSVTLNRGDVCLKLYNKNRSSHKFDSFVFGSSRSQAFKLTDWSEYLGSSSVPFHFDASNEGVYGILNKMRYLDELNVSMKNIMIVLDEECLTNNYNNKGHLFISPTVLSKESELEFYKTFIKDALDLKFIYAYFDYKIFNEHKGYMGWLISKVIPKGDKINGDIWYKSWDDSIEKDSTSYYSNLVNKGVFYKRDTINIVNNSNEISYLEKEQLKEIAGILKKHNSKYKIIISPLYNQISLSNERLEFIESTFNKASVYDFSGKNKFTDVVGNYYESSHYRPNVAKEIMKIMYDESNVLDNEKQPVLSKKTWL